MVVVPAMDSQHFYDLLLFQAPYCCFIYLHIQGSTFQRWQTFTAHQALQPPCESVRCRQSQATTSLSDLPRRWLWKTLSLKETSNRPTTSNKHPTNITPKNANIQLSCRFFPCETAIHKLGHLRGAYAEPTRKSEPKIAVLKLGTCNFLKKLCFFNLPFLPAKHHTIQFAFKISVSQNNKSSRSETNNLEHLNKRLRETAYAASPTLSYVYAYAKPTHQAE